MNDKPAYQFVDTNILVYAHDVSAGFKHERAKSLVRELWETQEGCLSVQVLSELYVTLTRKVARLAADEVAAQIVADLATWRCHETAAGDLLAAIQIQRRYGISLWDALVIRSASQLGCDVIWSEDLSTEQAYAGVRVVNPLAEDGS